MLGGNEFGSHLGASSWRAATLAVDMPQDRSFLLTPLEPVDPVHEQPEDLHRDLRSPGISPTPQKSLFEMDSVDLRAAERAWLQTVGSFKLNSMHALRASKASGDDSSSRKTSGCYSAAEDQTHIPSDFQEPASRPLSNEQLPDSTNEHAVIKACRELSLAPEGEHLLSMAEEESASRSRHSSMSLRQRFSTFMAARRSGSGTYASIPSSELDPAQGLGAAISDAGLDAAAPRAAMASPVTEQPASASLPVDRHVADGSAVSDTPGSATAAASTVYSSQPDSASLSADAHGEHDDLSQPHALALAAAVDALDKLDKTLESTHMQRRPFTRLMSIRRPSTVWGRPSQCLEAPAEMLQRSTNACSAQQAAPSSEGPNSRETATGQIQGGPAHFDSSASAGQLGSPQQPTNPESSHGASTPTQSSTQLLQAAELESHDSAIASADIQKTLLEEYETSAGNQADSAGETLSSPCIVESGQYEVPAEPLNAAAQSFKSLASSTVSRTEVSHAALMISPSDACSLESACPSFVGRLAHPAWHAQRIAASTGSTGMQQVKKKPMLRGRSAEECGVRMYERARVAQHVRQTR